jgi:hypothetical protein
VEKLLLSPSDFNLSGDGGGDGGGAALAQRANRPFRGRAQGVQLRRLQIT